jgi:hypothetical protein
MKKIIGLFLLLFSINGYCEWVNVGESDDGNYISYVDFNTKKTVSGYIRVWTLMDMKKSEGDIKSLIALEEFDCSSDRKRTIQLTGYKGSMGTGGTVGTEEGGNKWTYVIPNSLIDVMYKRVCK